MKSKLEKEADPGARVVSVGVSAALDLDPSDSSVQ